MFVQLLCYGLSERAKVYVKFIFHESKEMEKAILMRLFRTIKPWYRDLIEMSLVNTVTDMGDGLYFYLGLRNLCNRI